MTNPEQHIDRLSIELMGVGLPVLILILIAAVLYAVWYYRTTIPPVAGWQKCLLVTLRATALAILVIALAEPIITVIATVSSQSTIAVLIDNSSSMDQRNDPNRKNDALSVLDELRSLFGNDGAFFVFDTGIRTLESAEPDFSGSGTDMFTAITEAENNSDNSSVILISDGRWNLGESPLGSNLPDDIPVNTVSVGSGGSSADVVISRISTAAVARDGDTLSVDITVASSHELSEPVPVEITENGRVLNSRTVSLRNRTTAQLSFDIPLSVVGEHTFLAEIHPVEDEYAENNKRSFTVNIIKSSFRILLAADVPSPDLAFLRRVIEADDSYELDVVVAGGVAGELSSPFPEDLTEYDMLILIDWGGSALTPNNTDILKERIAEGCGLWILGSSQPGIRLDGIAEIFPVRFAGAQAANDSLLYLELTDIGITHFVTSTDGDARLQWNNLPPLSSILPVSTDNTEGRILAGILTQSPGKEQLPAIITGRYGSGKTLVMPVSGIWRWQLMMEGAGRSGGFFRNFVTGTINWLTSVAETSPLTVTTDYKTYLNGQEIIFEARLFDKIFTPLSGADITVVTDDDPSSKVILEETMPAVYTGTLRGYSEGEHTFKAVAFLDGDRYSESTGAFEVQDFSLEMLNPAGDAELMRAIAERTGGISIGAYGIDSLLTQIRPELRTERREDKHDIHLNPLMPLIAVVLFVSEWSIRKYRGMM